MLSPGINYQYAQAKDVAGGTLLIVNKGSVTVEPELAITSTLVIVPADKVFILSAFSATGRTGDLQDATLALAVRIIFERSEHELTRQENMTDPVRVIQETWTGEVWVPPSSSLEASATFDGNVAVNSLRFSIHGILIPRGNVQQG